VRDEHDTTLEHLAKLSEKKHMGGGSINRSTRNREVPLPILYPRKRDSQGPNDCI